MSAGDAIRRYCINRYTCSASITRINNTIYCVDISTIRFLCIDPKVNGSNPPLAKLSLRPRLVRVGTSLYLQAGIARSGSIERKDLDTAR